jgi:hypothetical protein
MYRGGSRHRPHLRLRRGLLDADGSGGADALLEICGALRRASGPLAQSSDLACL